MDVDLPLMNTCSGGLRGRVCYWRKSAAYSDGLPTFDEYLFQRVEGDSVVMMFGKRIRHSIASALACPEKRRGRGRKVKHVRAY